jgi:hypothetical protein
MRLIHFAKFAVGLFFVAATEVPNGSIQIIVATTSSTAMIEQIIARRLM